jgi:hypothetical protein
MAHLWRFMARQCELWVMRSGTALFDCRKQASLLGPATALLIVHINSWSLVLNKCVIFFLQADDARQMHAMGCLPCLSQSPVPVHHSCVAHLC